MKERASTEATLEKSRRYFRVLIVAYLISWLAAMTLSVIATEYDVSDRISEYNWNVFAIASVADTALIWISAIGLFLFAKWARTLFIVNVLYSLIYSYTFGGGSGNPITGVIATMNTMLAGAILYAIYCESSPVPFQRKVKKYSIQSDSE